MITFRRVYSLLILIALACLSFAGCGGGSQASGNSGSSSLSGTGGSTSAPAATFTPASLTFSKQGLNSVSSAESVTLTNTGNASLSLASVSVSGDFAQTNNCGSALSSGASCTISVTFTPTATGTRTGAISLTDNGPSSPQQVSLSGTGVATTSGTGVAATPSVTLSWSESSSSVVGYNVYRSTRSGTAYTEINLSLVVGQSYTDASVSAGQTYYYVVTAVNESGVQSAYSAQVSAVVPTS